MRRSCRTGCTRDQSLALPEVFGARGRTGSFIHLRIRERGGLLPAWVFRSKTLHPLSMPPKRLAIRGVPFMPPAGASVSPRPRRLPRRTDRSESRNHTSARYWERHRTAPGCQTATTGMKSARSGHATAQPRTPARPGPTASAARHRRPVPAPHSPAELYP